MLGQRFWYASHRPFSSKHKLPNSPTVRVVLSLVPQGPLPAPPLASFVPDPHPASTRDATASSAVRVAAERRRGVSRSMGPPDLIAPPAISALPVRALSRCLENGAVGSQSQGPGAKSRKILRCSCARRCLNSPGAAPAMSLVLDPAHG